MDGVEYSDSASIEVIEKPWFVIENFTNDTVFNDPSYWERQDYQDATRKTSIRYESNTLILEYNPDGTDTTLYADLRPLYKELPNFDEYALSVYAGIEGEFELTLTTNEANEFVTASGESFIINNQNAKPMYIPLAKREGIFNRLMTIQIRKTGSAFAQGSIRMSLCGRNA